MRPMLLFLLSSGFCALSSASPCSDCMHANASGVGNSLLQASFGVDRNAIKILRKLDRGERHVVPEGVLPRADLPEEEYYVALRDKILQLCGRTCSYEQPSKKGRFFDMVKKDTDCDSLFSDDAMHLDGLSNRWPPPKQIPRAFLADFTMSNESMPVKPWYLEKNAETTTEVWSQALVDKMIKEYELGNYSDWWRDEGHFTQGSYSHSETTMIHNFLRKYQSDIKGKHCAVIGSLSPWVESLLLSVGVANVTTIEYATIQSEHPKLRTLHPSDWGQLYHDITNGVKSPFDCMISYSSIEHAGLGRYGDIVNPWGDLIAMAKAMCSLKKGATFFLGFGSGEDAIFWNAHRTYGPKRWAQILANAEQLDYQQPPNALFSQGMVVARKM